MVFLVRAAVSADDVLAAGLADDAIELSPGLLAVDTALTRSKLYHRLKPLQPKGEPLLVVRLDQPPKMKAMAPGSTRWLRERFRVGGRS